MNALGIDKAPGSARVVVAMSGGVDSSVAAALLAERGYETVGITLQLYDHGRAVGRPGTCCAGADIHDARRVASALDIPHFVLDYESRFRRAVMDDFADTYLAGETPVPCARCNQTVKFTDLLETALDLGADALATGHYVRRVDGPDGPELHRGAQAARDQSYFLFATTREQLGLLRFPLGAMTKDETAGARPPAESRGLGQTRQSGHLLRAPWALRRRDRPAAPRRRRTRRYRRSRRRGSGPPSGRRPLHHRPEEGIGESRRPSRSSSSGSIRGSAR